jgi:DNA polymerase I-like protein with 3'-5' exonuclease and polymerase domains
VWRSGIPLLFHNAKFDLDVAETHLGLPVPPWHLFHDTLFLLFLADPHARTLSLKPAAEKWLGLPPSERDAVRDWVLAHVKGATSKSWGAYICKAPGELVGKYAIGDVDRTHQLFEFLYPEIVDREMLAPYDRERQLLPILLENERQGMRLDVERLEADLPIYEGALLGADEWLRERLGAPLLNCDSDAEIARALKANGIVEKFVLTPTGRDSTSKKNLTPAMFNDPIVASVLGYRNRITTVLSNNMRPWLDQARENNGYIFTEWNQVRQASGDSGSKGTRTGRLSCSRFQNISKSFTDKGDGYVHPEGLPDLPLVRRYILGDEGQLFCHRDYNQQEFRILAHYESGRLMQSYIDNPRMDMHDWMKATITRVSGLELERRAVKILNFGINYGMGIGKLAAGMGVDTGTATRLRNAQRNAVPDVYNLDKELKRRGQNGEPLRTWGGRLYFCEPPALIAGHMKTFEYKLLNYLIQGSAADCTKEAVIRYNSEKKDGRFLVTVHDEINFSADEGAAAGELALLSDVMASIEFDVPMLSDAKVGLNWGELQKLGD